MRRYRYDAKLAAGAIASAGTLAILIPPSIALIIYGVWTETSIGKLFIAGIVPGIVLAALFCAMIVLRCIAAPELGPRGPRYPWRERFASLARLVPTAAVFGIVLGGIYGGVFTPSEASAIGCVGVVFVAALLGRLSWRKIRASLHEAGTVSAMVYIIIGGGILITRFLVQTNVTPGLVDLIDGLGLDRLIVLALFAVMYLVLGAILDTFSMIILTLPFVFPIVPGARLRPGLVRHLPDRDDRACADNPADRPQRLRHEKRNARRRSDGHLPRLRLVRLRHPGDGGADRGAARACAVAPVDDGLIELPLRGERGWTQLPAPPGAARFCKRPVLCIVFRVRRVYGKPSNGRELTPC